MSAVPSFAQVCADHRHELVALIRKMSGSRDRAEDVVQDALIRAMRAWTTTTFARGEDLPRLRSWLFRVVVNTYYHSIEAERARQQAHNRSTGEHFDDYQPQRQDWEKHQGSTSLTPVADDRDDVMDALSPFGDEVATAVAGLGDVRWEVVRRHYVDGDEYEQIVEDLGIAHGTVSSTLWRAREVLARSLREYARAEYGLRASALGRARVHASAHQAAEVVEADAGGVDRVVRDVEPVALARAQ